MRSIYFHSCSILSYHPKFIQCHCSSFLAISCTRNLAAAAASLVAPGTNVGTVGLGFLKFSTSQVNSRGKGVELVFQAPRSLF